MSTQTEQQFFSSEIEAAIKEARGIVAGTIPTKRYNSFNELLKDIDL